MEFLSVLSGDGTTEVRANTQLLLLRYAWEIVNFDIDKEIYCELKLTPSAVNMVRSICVLGSAGSFATMWILANISTIPSCPHQTHLKQTWLFQADTLR